MYLVNSSDLSRTVLSAKMTPHSPGPLPPRGVLKLTSSGSGAEKVSGVGGDGVLLAVLDG